MTFSHVLANDDHEIKGHTQIRSGEDEIEDLGWNEKKEDIAAPLVGGMDNEELWLLLRRFDKVSHQFMRSPEADHLHHRSKSTISRQRPTRFPEDWTSTLPTRKSFLPTNSGPISSASIRRLASVFSQVLSTSRDSDHGGNANVLQPLRESTLSPGFSTS